MRKSLLLNTLVSLSLLSYSASTFATPVSGESGKVDGKSANRPAASVVGGALESALPPSMRCGECPKLPIDSTQMCVIDLAVCPGGRGYYAPIVSVPTNPVNIYNPNMQPGYSSTCNKDSQCTVPGEVCVFSYVGTSGNWGSCMDSVYSDRGLTPFPRP